jgi:hypothetical protein
MLIERMIRAAQLDVGVYEEVEHDESATQQALIVVILVALASIIGGIISVAMSPAVPAGVPGAAQPSIVGAIVGGLLSAFLGWILWAYVTYFVGTSFFGGTATPGEMLRTLGFAQAPGVLRILIFIPVLGGIIGFITAIWTLVTGVIAIRQALDFTTGKAIATAVISFIVVIIVMAVLGLILAGIGLAFMAV